MQDPIIDSMDWFYNLSLPTYLSIYLLIYYFTKIELASQNTEQIISKHAKQVYFVKKLYYMYL